LLKQEREREKERKGRKGGKEGRREGGRNPEVTYSALHYYLEQSILHIDLYILFKMPGTRNVLDFEVCFFF
jgi:hypothetical protein